MNYQGSELEQNQMTIPQQMDFNEFRKLLAIKYFAHCVKEQIGSFEIYTKVGQLTIFVNRACSFLASVYLFIDRTFVLRLDANERNCW